VVYHEDPNKGSLPEQSVRSGALCHQHQDVIP